MINKPRTYVKTGLYREVVTPYSKRLIGNYNMREEYVTSAAIIKGDKHNPYPWSYSVFTRVPFRGEAVDRQGNYGGGYQNPIYSKFSGPLQGIMEPDLTTKSKASVAYNKALDDLNDKVRGGLDLSVAMAESSATFRMVRALSKAKRYFSGIGSKRWANEWLELQYGWLPLLSDVYGAANEIIHVNLGLMYFKGRGSNSENTSVDLSSGGAVDISGVSNYTANAVITKSKIKVFNACELKVLLKPPTSIQSAARWSSLNPVSIAWELVPYSFVFDWFYDVGSWLRNQETAMLYDSAFVTGYRSELFAAEHTSKVAYSRDFTDNFTFVTRVTGESSAVYKTFSRTILYSYPTPRKPVVNTDLSAKRLLSAASLLRQFLK